MKQVAEAHHFQKRWHSWYFIRRVPRYLVPIIVPIIGRQFFTASLATADLKVVNAKRSALNGCGAVAG